MALRTTSKWLNDIGFSETGFSWDGYESFRPRYPQSLWERVLSYHNFHHAQFDKAHDMGAGSGVVASELAYHFPYVYVSDPAQNNLEAAKKNLTSDLFVNGLVKPCVFEFSQRRGEEFWIPNGTLDMVTMFEAIHWTNSEEVAKEMARSLKRNGTLALCHYNMKPAIIGNQFADDLWSSIVAERLQAEIRLDSSTAHAQKQSGLGLDHVPLYSDLWREGVKRIYVNVEEKGSRSFGDWRITKAELARLKTSLTDSVERIQDVENWSKEVDASWFPMYLDTLQLGYKDLEDDSLEKTSMRQLQQAIGQGTIRVLWSAEIVLATRL